MMMAIRVVGIALLAFVLMGFDAEDAKRLLDGQWEGRTAAWSLAIDTKAGTGTFVDGGKRTSGRFVLDEVVGRSASFHIANQEFTAHFQESGLHLSLGTGPDFRMEKVK